MVLEVSLSDLLARGAISFGSYYFLERRVEEAGGRLRMSLTELLPYLKVHGIYEKPSRLAKKERAKERRTNAQEAPSAGGKESRGAGRRRRRAGST